MPYEQQDEGNEAAARYITLSAASTATVRYTEGSGGGRHNRDGVRQPQWKVFVMQPGYNGSTRT